MIITQNANISAHRHSNIVMFILKIHGRERAITYPEDISIACHFVKFPIKMMVNSKCP